jgi:hypothetical protein
MKDAGHLPDDDRWCAMLRQSAKDMPGVEADRVVADDRSHRPDIVVVADAHSGTMASDVGDAYERSMEPPSRGPIHLAMGPQS